MKAAGLMQSLSRHSCAMKCGYKCTVTSATAPLLSSSRLCTFTAPSPAFRRSSSTQVHAGWYDGDGEDRDSRGSDRPNSYRDRDSSYGGGRSSRSYGGGRSSRGGGRGGRGGGTRDNSTDWACPECGYSNFGRNTSCRSCEAPRPADYAPPARQGDWECPSCGASNFARRTSCFKCDEPVPEAVLAARPAFSDPPAQREPAPRKEGDWDCPSCGAHNFSRRTTCFKCYEPAPEAVLAARPQQEAQPGDWSCPECGEVNFERRRFCRSCDTPRPGGGGGRDRGERQEYGAREYGGREYGGRQERREYAPRQQREQYERREYVAKEGDWTCNECGGVNYAYRTECFKCKAPK